MPIRAETKEVTAVYKSSTFFCLQISEMMIGEVLPSVWGTICQIPTQNTAANWKPLCLPLCNVKSFDQRTWVITVTVLIFLAQKLLTKANKMSVTHWRGPSVVCLRIVKNQKEEKKRFTHKSSADVVFNDEHTNLLSGTFPFQINWSCKSFSVQRSTETAVLKSGERGLKKWFQSRSGH